MAPTYLANLTLFDGRAVKAKHGVLVEEGVIAWVGPHARAPRAARSATEVPGEGRTLTPGLIDCHVHLQYDGGADFEAEGRALTPATAALKAAENLKRHLANGVTTVRDLGGMDAVSCEVGVAVDRGLIPGPRVLAAGRALTITGGHGHNVAFAREVDGADAMRKAVREEIRAGREGHQGGGHGRRAHAGHRRHLHGVHPRRADRGRGRGAQLGPRRGRARHRGRGHPQRRAGRASTPSNTGATSRPPSRAR